MHKTCFERNRKVTSIKLFKFFNIDDMIFIVLFTIYINNNNVKLMRISEIYNFIGPEVYNSHDSLQYILRKIY